MGQFGRVCLASDTAYAGSRPHAGPRRPVGLQAVDEQHVRAPEDLSADLSSNSPDSLTGCRCNTLVRSGSPTAA